MKREFSIYLDIIRFLAAALVLIHHSNFRLLSTERIWFSQHGPAAVIIFFVLSGYVISYVTTVKEREPVDYWSSRLSRFYSLALPIVLLCPLLDSAGEMLSPQFYGEGRTTHGFALLRIVTSLAFVNEMWTIAIMSFSNVPYWSLNYEMWYYAMFAIIAFTRGRARFGLACAVVLLVGPKILLLAPIWVLGVFLHKYERLYRLASWQYWMLFILSWPLYGLYLHYQVAEYSSDLVLRVIGPWWHAHLSFSKYFIGNYLLALVIGANFVGFRGIAHQFSWLLLPSEKAIRWLSGYTFSLYILHQPLLQFYAAIFNGDPAGKLFYTEVIVATLLTIGLIGRFTEHQRHHLRAWIRRKLVSLTESQWWQQGVTARIAQTGAGT